MSEHGSAWMISRGRGDQIGPATVADGLWTLEDHGLVDGQSVMVDGIDGLDIVVSFGLYHVRDVDGDEFRLSATIGGVPLDVGSGTADVYLLAGEMSAGQLRRVIGGLLAPGDTGRLGGRQGVRPGGGPVVELSGSTVVIRAHQGVLDPGWTSVTGPYPYELAEHSLPLDPPDGAQDRTDIAVVGVADDLEDLSGEREVYGELITGTPGGGVPATPGGAMRVATIDVPADGQGSPTLTVDHPWTAAAGGILPVREQADLPASGRYDGFPAYVQSRKELVTWDSDENEWRPQQRGWTPIVTNEQITGVTTFPVDPEEFDAIRVRLRGSLDEVGFPTVRINNDDTSEMHRFGYAVTRLSDGETVNTDADNRTVWPIARWSDGPNNVADLVIYRTHVSSLLTFQGGGFRAASSLTTRQKTISGGDLASSRLLDSLRFSALSDAGFTIGIGTIEVSIEGHRP